MCTACMLECRIAGNYLLGTCSYKVGSYRKGIVEMLYMYVKYDGDLAPPLKTTVYTLKIQTDRHK